MLADSAQAIDNKLYILGGGWSITGPDPTPTAIALHLSVPWTETNEKHKIVLELLDPDGDAIRMGPEPLRIETDFEMGRPPGIKPGTPLELALALNLAPLPLEPGKRYEWRLLIDGDTDEHWTLPFSVRAAPQPN